MPIPALLQKHALNGVTALLFGVTVWRLGLVPKLPAVLAFIFGGVLLAVIDWKVQRLPARLVYLAAGRRRRRPPLRFARGVGLGAAGHSGRRGRVVAGASTPIWSLTRRFLGLVILGFGDVRLATVLGMVLGWYGLDYVYYGAIVSHLLAVAIGVVTCIHRRKLRLRYASVLHSSLALWRSSCSTSSGTEVRPSDLSAHVTRRGGPWRAESWLPNVRGPPRRDWRG